MSSCLHPTSSWHHELSGATSGCKPWPPAERRDCLATRCCLTSSHHSRGSHTSGPADILAVASSALSLFGPLPKRIRCMWPHSAALGAAQLQALPVVCLSRIRRRQSALPQAPESFDSWDWTLAPLHSAVPQKVLRELIKLAVALPPQSLMPSELVPSTLALSQWLTGHAIRTHRVLDGSSLTQDVTSSTTLCKMPAGDIRPAADFCCTICARLLSNGCAERSGGPPDVPMRLQSRLSACMESEALEAILT